jgi:hypothetical protein
MGKIAVTLATAALTLGSLATMTAAQSQQPGALSLRTRRKTSVQSGWRVVALGAPGADWERAESAAPIIAGAASADRTCFRSGQVNSTTRPSRMVTRRSICAAMSRL